MKLSLLFIGTILSAFIQAQEGLELFQLKCSACHTIGQGRLVGPDLYDISGKRERDWLVDFIRSSQTLIKSGDQQAVATYEQYNKILMPDAGLSDAEIESVLNYIETTSKSGGQQDQPVSAPDMLAAATNENIRAGARLFSGADRLSNRGQACSACHRVKDNAIFSSGSLARELTLTYETMGTAGVAAILRSPPFPAMKDAYANHSLTDEEVLNLTAYLKSVSQNRYYQNARDYSLLFVFSGIVIFIMIFSATIILYFRRKRGNVNEAILSRQTQAVH